MAANHVPAPPPLSPSNEGKTEEIIKFLREENEKNRTSIFTDARESRDLINSWFKIAGSVLSLLIAVAAIFGFKSFSDLQKTYEEKMQKLQTDVLQRVDDHFKDPNIQDMMEKAAKTAAKDVTTEAIHQEIARQVKTRLDAEALGMKGQIRVQNLIALMTQNDDASAFDQLNLMVRSGNLGAQESRIAKDALQDISQKLNSAPPMFLAGSPNLPYGVKEGELVQKVMSSTNPMERRSVLAQLAPTVWGDPGKTLQIAKNDPFLTVRCDAGRFYAKKLSQDFGGCLEKDRMDEYMKKHAKEIF
jgi:hypothetical protein